MKPWERELAARQTRTRAEAITRFRRGHALVQAALDAALAGKAPPPLPATVPQAGPDRVEYVSCRVCYAPILGPAGSICPKCQPPAPER